MVTRDELNLYGSFLFLFTGLLFLYQTRSRNRNTPTLTAGFFVAFFGQLFNSTLTLYFEDSEIISFLDPVLDPILLNLDLNGIIALNVFFLTMTNAILVFFWIFLEHSNDTRVSPTFLVSFTVFASMFGGAVVLSLILGDFRGLAFANLMFALLLNLVVWRSVYILYEVYNATGKERIALFQLVSFALIAAWGILAMVLSTASLRSEFVGAVQLPSALEIVADVLYYGGLAIFILTILLNPDYIYRLPLNIQDIIILSKYGMALYGIGINADEKSLDEQMLAGFVTAANSFIKEMQPPYPNEVITSLESSGRILRMQFGEEVGVCVVSAKENVYLRRSVQNLVRHIDALHPEEMIMTGQFFSDEEVRIWLKAYFPYLGIDKWQSY